MKIKSRIKERGFNAALITLLYVVAGICSLAQAQSFTPTENDQVFRLTNANKTIQHAANANLNAKAVKMSSAINSAFEELKPALAPCGNKLYFSRLGHPTNHGKADHEDIWYSKYDTVSKSWSDPIHMPGYLNNEGPNFINNVSLTGDTIILGNQYLRNGKMRAGLSYSVNEKGLWSVPKTIKITNDYNISDHANSYVCLKTGVIISAIQREETYGERDLYVSFWNGEEATEPINMGAMINSELEESSPYLASDNKTLYFASKGHNGYGGHDIFVTTRLDDTWTNWSEPENLGPAVNGSLDDEFFSISHCGNFAVFSKQINVHNVDLFRISIEELFGQPAIKEYKKEKRETHALAFMN